MTTANAIGTTYCFFNDITLSYAFGHKKGHFFYKEMPFGVFVGSKHNLSHMLR
jgi:hypothetical protein